MPSDTRVTRKEPSSERAKATHPPQDVPKRSKGADAASGTDERLIGAERYPRMGNEGDSD
jgi:hypothetical protein